MLKALIEKIIKETIAEMLGVESPTEQSGATVYAPLIGRIVVVRSHLSGVWLGVLECAGPNGFRLSSARRAWSWSGAASCSGLASHGPSAGKITAPVESVAIPEIVEIVGPVSVAALSRWDAVLFWSAT